MKRLSKLAVRAMLAAGVGGLFTVITMGPATSAPGPTPASVLVVNTASQPVPTTPQGTTTVQGAVTASQEGIWNVGVTGTVDVNVTNTAPVPVTVQGGATDAPMVMNASATSFSSLGEATLVLYTVPSDKRLLVDQIGFNTHVATGSVVASICWDGFVNCLPIPLQNQGTVAGANYFVGSQQVTYFADPGTQLLGACAKTTQQSGDYCSATFVGRLVDITP
jgi:hypothetical protein